MLVSPAFSFIGDLQVLCVHLYLLSAFDLGKVSSLILDSLPVQICTYNIVQTLTDPCIIK